MGRILEIYSGVVIYIMLHRIIKRQIFQRSRYSIHGVRRQDIRMFSGIVITYMIMRIIMLSALVGIVIVRSKEVIVLSGGIIMILLVVGSMIYSVGYLNKLGLSNGVGEVEG